MGHAAGNSRLSLPEPKPGSRLTAREPTSYELRESAGSYINGIPGRQGGRHTGKTRGTAYREDVEEADLQSLTTDLLSTAN